MHYVPLGHADLLTLILFDDFDPIQFVASDLQSPLEEVSVAFCPTTQVQTAAQQVIRIPIIDTFDSRDRNDVASVVHRIQDQHPLLCFARLKLSGMTTLGSSTTFLSCAIAEIEDICENILTLLRERVFTTELFEEKDLDTIKVSVTRLLGGEELGVLIFCRNLTVAMCIVSQIEKMTFGDVFQQSNDELENNHDKSRLVCETFK